MKYLFRLKIMLLLLSFAVMKAQTDPDLELTEGSADITIKGPTDNVTFNFLRDANNPGAPSYDTAPNPLSVTFKISNNQHTYTHYDPSWPSTRSFDFGNAYGSPDYISQKLASGSSHFGYAANYSQLFTYAGYATPGTGIVAPRGAGAGSVLNQNYAVNTFITTNGLADAGIPSNSTVYMADFTVEFSRPVNNPVLHFVGLGSVLNAMNASAMYELNPTLSLPSSGVSLSKLSGSPNFNVSGLQVSNSDFPIQQLAQAAGSVLVTGKGITKLVFKVYIRGDGNTSNGNDPLGWGRTPTVSTDGEGQMISVSVQESELQVTKTIDKPNARVGENVVFTVTATNNGISNSSNTLVNDLLPSGYTFVSATPSLGTYDSTTGVWNIGLLGGSTNATLAITATVNTSASQSNYTNTATITGDNVDLDLTNNSATVTPNVIDAVNDSYTMPSSGGNVTGSVLDNDTYNTTAIPLSGTTITVVTPATGGGTVPTLNTSTGIVNVPAGTPAGTYTITYQICRASACDEAVITVNVTEGLNLNPDSGSTTVGTPITVPNVVSNDTYNGLPITIGAGAGQGTVSQSGTWPAGFTLNPATGEVNVAGSVPAGNYPVEYQVCINGANPAQCATETVTIAVTNTLTTTPDTGSGLVGTTFIAEPNVLANDTLNGSMPVIGTDPGQVTISQFGTWLPGITLDVTTGEVTVNSTVAAGTYIVEYQVCVNDATPTLCETEELTIEVLEGDNIYAVQDINQTPKGKHLFGNVKTNDESIYPIDVVSATQLDGSVIPLETNTRIYDENGIFAGEIRLNVSGNYNFVPDPSYIGEVEISYTIRTADGLEATTTLTIKVLEGYEDGNNYSPIAQNDVLFTESGVVASSTLFNNDSDPDSSFSLTEMKQGATVLTSGSSVSGISNTGTPVANAGTIVFNADGTYIFTPAAGFSGTINPIEYTITDADGILTDSAELYVTVQTASESDLNNTYANDDAQVGTRGQSLIGNVLNNDIDPEGNVQNVSSISHRGNPLILNQVNNIPNVGSVIVRNDGSYEFIPLATFYGTLPITYSSCDVNPAGNTCCSATLYLTTVSTSVCYKPANIADAGLPTQIGISTIGESQNWPQNRLGAHLVVESKTKGVVLPRMTSEEIQLIPNKQIGMTVYDTTLNCVRIYSVTNRGELFWNCFTKPSCDDNQ